MNGRPRRILDGAVVGVATWCIYGLAASLLHVTILVLDGDRIVIDSYWRIITSTLAGLALAGLILGASIGAITARGDRLRLGLALTLAAFLCWYEVLRSGTWLHDRVLAVTPVLALLAWQVISPSRKRVLSLLQSPWVASFLLVVPPWLPRMARWETASGLIVAVTLAAFAVAWMTAGRRTWILGEGGLAVAALALIAGLPHTLRAPSLDARGPRLVAEPGRPNIILIVWDTVRADRLSAYGYERDTTPHLRDFAREATLFQRAIATSSWTLGSHASMMTGLYCDAHGAHAGSVRHGDALSRSAFTLAEALQAEGYRTAAVVANHAFLARKFGINQGFEHYDARAPLRPMPDRGLHNAPLVKSLIALTNGRRRDASIVYRTAPEIRREAEVVVERTRRDGRPFFLLLNFMDAHEPLRPPAPYDTRYPGVMPGVTEGQAREWRVRSVRDNWSPPAGFREHQSSLYDGAIAYLDQETMRFLQRIKEMNLFDNSLIFITSDHGETLGERNYWMHPVSVSQGQVHIPLVIKFPGSRQRAVSDEVVSLADLMPTALSAGRVRIRPKVDGRDLASPPSPGGRRVFADHISAEPMVSNYGKRAARRQHAVFADGMKYIVMSDGSKELYDPWADPNEEKNLYRPGDEAIGRLDAMMQSRIKLFKTPGKPSLGLSPADIERLRSLGYVQ